MAGSLSIFGLALANPASAADTVTSERLAGATRYGTSAAIAADEAFAAPTMAIVASGETANLADALAASSLAGANAPAPIVLTQSNAYTAETKAALAGLKGKGVNSITIVGGTAAVAESVASAIAADGFTVTRVAGTDRYETAAAISTAADRAGSAELIDGMDTALVASGTSFADALAGSPAAANTGIPLLLVESDSIPQASIDAMTALGIKKAVILGGTAPVSEAVASQLASLTGNPVTRLAGENRFGTAAAIGDWEIDTLDFAATSAILANGVTFADALSAGPLGGVLEAPIVLTASLPAESQAFLDDHSDTITKLYIAGGTAAVDEATVTAATTAAQNTANDPDVPGASQTAALTGPELQSVAVSDIDTDFDTLEIEYTFTFDKSVDEDELNADAFKLYSPDTRVEIVGEEADSRGAAVAVTFDLAGGAASATLAAVETGAVVDDDNNENPPQSVRLSPLSGTGSPSADLVDIDVTNEDDAEVTFTFNSTVYPEALAAYGFFLVTEDGDVFEATEAVTEPDDDDPSTTVLATFDDLVQDDDPLTPPTPDTDDVVRGYVTYFVNQTVQNVDIRGGGDVDLLPDLESVEYPSENSDLDDDEVLFTFDEDIDTADAGEFFVYFGTAGSTAVAGLSTDVDDDAVTVTFPEEAINELTAGAYVLEGGALDLDGDGANLTDGELGEYASVAAEVVGPQLEGVEIDTDTDSFGDFNEYTVTFTFDTDIADGDDLDGFSIFFDEDGETTQSELDNCDVDDDNTVICSDDDEESDIGSALVAAVDFDAVQTDAAYTTGGPATVFPSVEASFAVSATEAAS